MVTPAAASTLLMMLSPATGAVIAIVGAAAFSANTTGVLAPVLPAASVSLATMLWVPLPDKIGRASGRVSVQISVVAVSVKKYMTAVELSTIVIVTAWLFIAAKQQPAEEVLWMVELAAVSIWSMMLSPATGVVIAIVGAAVFSANTTGVLAPVLPATSVSLATMLWVPLPDSATLVDHAPPLPTAAMPTCVVTPLAVSFNGLVPPAAAPGVLESPVIFCVA